METTKPVTDWGPLRAAEIKHVRRTMDFAQRIVKAERVPKNELDSRFHKYGSVRVTFVDKSGKELVTQIACNPGKPANDSGSGIS